VLCTSPRHAQHSGYAELRLSTSIQVEVRLVLEPEDDLELVGVAAVFREATLELGDIADGLVPGVGPAESAVAIACRASDGASE
jgi:hypothetical protein